MVLARLIYFYRATPTIVVHTQSLMPLLCSQEELQDLDENKIRDHVWQSIEKNFFEKFPELKIVLKRNRSRCVKLKPFMKK